MGKLSEAVEDGVLCARCFTLLVDDNGGHPMRRGLCDYCRREEARRWAETTTSKPAEPRKAPKVQTASRKPPA